MVFFVLLSGDMKFDIFCDTLTLQFWTEDWPNDDLWIRFCICRHNSGNYCKMWCSNYCQFFNYL